eukprot:SAG11_NODE_4681_length_1808_cov_2.149795_1_plen_115_part_00
MIQCFLLNLSLPEFSAERAGAPVIPAHPGELVTVPRSFGYTQILMMVLLAMPLAVIDSGITNFSFSNFSDRVFDADETFCVSLGLNYCLTPPVDSVEDVLHSSFEPYERRCHLA